MPIKEGTYLLFFAFTALPAHNTCGPTHGVFSIRYFTTCAKSISATSSSTIQMVVCAPLHRSDSIHFFKDSPNVCFGFVHPFQKTVLFSYVALIKSVFLVIIEVASMTSVNCSHAKLSTSMVHPSPYVHETSSDMGINSLMSASIIATARAEFANERKSKLA